MNNKILIKNGKIYDSINKKFFKGNIVVEDETIKNILHEEVIPENKSDYLIIDAEGKIVSPGFIDIHSHEDKLEDTNSYCVADDMLRMGVTTCIAGNCGSLFTPIEYFKKYAALNGIPVNYMFFSGYGTHRNALGINKYDKCDDEKILSKIVNLINEDLENGAIGISFGLEYFPGVTDKEIINVCNMIGRKDIKLAFHIRADQKDSADAVREVVNISRITDLPVFISHIGSMAAQGYIREAFKVIEDAVSNNLKVFVDCYPYNAFCTTIGSAVFDEDEMAEGKFSYEQIKFATGPYIGQYCTEELYTISRAEYPESYVIGFNMLEDEVKYALSHELTIIGSDGYNMENCGHPRTAGTFPRVIGKYARDEKIMTVEEALYKMTYKPRQALSLKNKGVIAVGADADIVIFDENTIIDKADYNNVNEPPEGIEYVIINGSVALRNGKISEQYYGKVR